MLLGGPRRRRGWAFKPLRGEFEGDSKSFKSPQGGLQVNRLPVQNEEIELGLNLDRILLLLGFFALLHDEAELARVLPVERLHQGFSKRAGLGELGEHTDPRNGLKA